MTTSVYLSVRLIPKMALKFMKGRSMNFQNMLIIDQGTDDFIFEMLVSGRTLTLRLPKIIGQVFVGNWT